MHPDRDLDLDLEREAPPSLAALTQDLGLDTLYDAMGAGDRFLRALAAQVVPASLTDPAEISYRQEVLRDCLDHPEVVREVYAAAVEAIEGERKVYGSLFSRRSPEAVLHRCLEVLELFIGVLTRLRRIAEREAATFASPGFRRLFALLVQELDDDYLRTVAAHLRQLQFRDGLLLSAELGQGNKGWRYTLRSPWTARPGWRSRLAAALRSPNTIEIADRDEAGATALAELRARGINLVANAAAQSSDHVLAFFTALRGELGFYLGCLNLHERLAERGLPTCVPLPEPAGTTTLVCRGLYDPGLALRQAGVLVGNDVRAVGTSLVVVTGANQGGKSTFLRSVGLAQLMMQCGMFAPASSFAAEVRSGLFTHFKREEDAAMASGKLDEELRRMSAIAGELGPGSMVLFNESFSSTNEREGSEIARQVLRALLEAGIKVVFVTHFFDLAQSVYLQRRPDTLFLRAQRGEDGARPFRLVEGEPLPTGYGEDLYQRVFGTPAGPGRGPGRA